VNITRMARATMRGSTAPRTASRHHPKAGRRDAQRVTEWG
jgi:hypothetical protein